MSSICVILLKYFKVEFGLHHEILPLKISSYTVESKLSCFGMCNSASIFIRKMFRFLYSLQDAFEKRSRGASAEPPVHSTAEIATAFDKYVGTVMYVYMRDLGKRFQVCQIWTSNDITASFSSHCGKCGPCMYS